MRTENIVNPKKENLVLTSVYKILYNGTPHDGLGKIEVEIIYYKIINV